MLVLYQTQKAPPRFHGAGSFVKSAAAPMFGQVNAWYK